MFTYIIQTFKLCHNSWRYNFLFQQKLFEIWNYISNKWYKNICWDLLKHFCSLLKQFSFFKNDFYFRVDIQLVLWWTLSRRRTELSRTRGELSAPSRHVRTQTAEEEKRGRRGLRQKARVILPSNQIKDFSSSSWELRVWFYWRTAYSWPINRSDLSAPLHAGIPSRHSAAADKVKVSFLIWVQMCCPMKRPAEQHRGFGSELRRLMSS